MPTVEIEQLHKELQTVWTEMKSTLETQDKEIKTTGDATGETKAKVDALNARLDAIEAQTKRPRTTSIADLRDAGKTDERKAFILGLKKGIHSLRTEHKDMAGLVQIASPGEAKALSLGDETSGGFLAPPDFVADIIKGVILYSPIRSIATVRPTTNRSIQMPVRKGVYAAQWVSETGQRSETTGLKYGLEEIPNHEMYSEVLISNQDLEDSAFDMDAQLQMEASEQFAVLEGKGFVNGTGVGQPEGLLTNSAIAVVNNGGATVLLYAGLASLFYTGVKSAYAAQGTWLLNRKSIGLVRQIVDSNGRPLWEPGFPGFDKMEPPTIFGRPYIETPDMPDVAGAAYPIIFGNIGRGYVIVDRVQMVVQRLVEKYAEQGQISYLVRKRVGGQVILAEAQAKLKMA